MSRSRVVQTPRGWGAMAGGLVALAAGFLTLNLLLLLVGTMILGYVATDFLAFAYVTRDFGPEDFRLVRRENTALLGVGATGTMALEIESRRRRGVYVEVYDRVPDSLLPIAGAPHLLTWWGPGRTKSLVYAFRAVRRGRFEIGPTVLVAHDPFGFVFRTAVVENRWPVEVLPQVALWTTEVADRLRTEILGQLLARPQGQGTEFRSLREYQDSDDYRSIVWKRSTFERLLVKQREVEGRIDIALLLDLTRPMGEGPPGGEALDLAVEAAMLVARYSFSQGDRIAILLHSDATRVFLPLDRSTDHRLQVDRALGGAQIETGRFHFDDALRFLAQRLPSPTTVFAFTALEPGLEGPLAGLDRLRRGGHRLFTFVPDPEALFEPLEDPLAVRVESFTAGHEESRRRAEVDRLRALGVPVTLFGRSDLFQHVTLHYARARVDLGGS